MPSNITVVARPLSHLFVAAALLPACGDKEGPGPEVPGGGGPAERACYDFCDLQAQGEGCDADAYEAQCHELCDEPLVPLGDCEAEAQAAWSCMTAEAWVCDGTHYFDGVDQPQLANDQACAGEANDLAECISPPQGGETRFTSHELWCDAGNAHAATALSGPMGNTAWATVTMVDLRRGHTESHLLSEGSWNAGLDETTWSVAVPLVDEPASWEANVASAFDCEPGWTELWTAWDGTGTMLTCAVYNDTTGIFNGLGCEVFQD